MSSLPKPAAADLAELTSLHRETRYLDAYRAFQKFSAPETWQDSEAAILAGRLFSCWGDWGRSNRLHLQSWRRAPTSPAAVYYGTLTVEAKHGPFEALAFLRAQHPAATAASHKGYEIWLPILEARLRATFRDFDAAEALFRASESAGADDPWWWVEFSRFREKQDRYAEALTAVEHALKLAPNYRPSIETNAHLLMLLNRDDEALALLRQSVRQLQAGSLAQTLSILLSELEQHEECLATLATAFERLPCADRAQRIWFASRRCDALRALGRDAEAAEQAKLVPGNFHGHVAKCLSEPAAVAKRVHLRVPFVRQHHMTCAPATLSAIGDFWRRPVDHLELARIICYDGTPDHEERHWMETHGWVVREFRVTWEAAVALLDAGCPFTLTTVSTRSAHLQAVVGYDARLGLLLIRDPYQRTHGECIGAPFLEAAASHGPRGMVVVPPERATVLEGIALADAALYDHSYALRRALLRHDRVVAGEHAAQLAAAAPGHRLDLQAQRELSFYDCNQPRQLELTRSLLALFPNDGNLLLDEAQLLRGIGHPKERRERVEALGQRRNPEPLFLREYAEWLTEDARTHPRAQRILRRMLRRHPVEAGNLRAFGNLLWSQQRFREATDVYRLAACTADKVEFHWDTFFSASRHTQQVEQCLELLRQRNARLGAQSGQPARTLFRACDTLDRTPEGFEVLDAAVTHRPDEGELLLYAAENHGRFGHHDQSARLLAAAEGKAPRWLWLRTAARLDDIRLDYTAALARWRELLALNPVDAGAHASIASLVATLEGRPAARAFLKEACQRHPNQIPLHHQLLEWHRNEPAEEALAIVDHLLGLEPTNAWALREKALILRRHNRAEEALAAADAALLIEPNAPASAGVRGMVLSALDRLGESRAAFEDALRLSIDSNFIDDLLGVCREFADRKSAIVFLQTELTRQAAPDGGAFLRFRDAARGVLAPEEMRTSLESLLKAHPDNWGIWSALGAHLLDQGEIAAALDRTRGAVERFPLVPRAWLDRALVQSRARQPEAEIESLRRTLELSPAWGYASRTLATAHERLLQLDQAEHALRRAITADPLDPISHGSLAVLIWRRNQRDEAVTLLERAVTLQPDYDWAWDRLDEWCHERTESKRALERAEALTRDRPGDARAWIRLARLQSREPDAALATLDRALAIEPRNADVHDLRAFMLATAKRYDEALAACRPAVYSGQPPRDLLARAAWIEHARGRLTQAIEQVQALVSAHPDFLWAWSCLAEWSWEAERFREAEEAAGKWAWLAPGNAVPHGYIAAARQRAGKRREAKDSYWRALHCNPAYSYGAQMLLQMLADDREAEEASRLLRHIETHLTPADAQRAAVFYHVMGRDKIAAGKALSALARVSSDQVDLLREACKALTEAGWRSVAEESLGSALTDASALPTVGRLWVDAWAPEGTWRKLRQLEKPGVTEPVRREAWAAALEVMGKNHARWRLRWLAYRRGAWLRAHNDTWGAMAYALIASRRYKAASHWLRDWREHQDVEPWILFNLTTALLHQARSADARPVVDHALTLSNDSMRNGFLIWRGLEEALRGDLAAAQATRAMITDTPIGVDMKIERTLFEILLEFENQATANPGEALRHAKQRIKEEWAAAPNPAADAAVVHWRARILRRIGRVAGSTWTRAQSYLPAPGRRDSAQPAGRVGDMNWWILFPLLLGLSSLLRNCSPN